MLEICFPDMLEIANVRDMFSQKGFIYLCDVEGKLGY